MGDLTHGIKEKVHNMGSGIKETTDVVKAAAQVLGDELKNKTNVIGNDIQEKVDEMKVRFDNKKEYITNRIEKKMLVNELKSYMKEESTKEKK